VRTPRARAHPRFSYRNDGQLHRTQANIDAAIDKYGIKLNRGANVHPSSRMRGAYGETNRSGEAEAAATSRSSRTRS
jgi:hypothetical protein